MYQYFKRQLKTPTCFGSFGIHPQGVLKRASLKLLVMFCVRGTIPYKFDIPFHITVHISRCQTPTTHTKHHK